jgi:polygalacturonase
MPTVSELTSKRISNTLTNVKTWGGILYNVKDYGAKGDGATDDTTKIQEAINSANTEGGGNVYVPNSVGAYMISTLTLPANVKLECAEGAELKQIASTNGHMLTITGSNVSFINMTLNGNKINQTNPNFGVYCIDIVENITFNNCRIYDTENGSLKLKNITGLSIIGCVFQSAGENDSVGKNEVAIGQGCKDARVTNNRFYGSASINADNVALIIAEGASYVSVENNYFENYESEVIQVLTYNGGLEQTTNRTHSVVIKGNIIDGSGRKAATGIHIGENCDYVSVIGNICFDAIIGIKVGQWVRNIVVNSNECYKNELGITVLGTAYGDIVISGNSCYRNDNDGILLVGSAGDNPIGVIITNNVCMNNSQVGTITNGGIKVDAELHKCIISDNVCTDDQATKTQVYGIILGAHSFIDLIVKGNQLKGNLTASSLVNTGRKSFSSVNNAEDTPNLYNATFNYSVAGGGVATVWTAPNSEFNDRGKRVVLRTTNPSSSSTDAGVAGVCFGRSATGLDTVAIYNPSANAVNGTGYIYLEE